MIYSSLNIVNHFLINLLDLKDWVSNWIDRITIPDFS